MVHCIQMRFVFCVRLANRVKFLAVRGQRNEKFLRIMDEKKNKSNRNMTEKTKTSWSPVCCAFLGHSGPLV